MDIRERAIVYFAKRNLGIEPQCQIAGGCNGLTALFSTDGGGDKEYALALLKNGDWKYFRFYNISSDGGINFTLLNVKAFVQDAKAMRQKMFIAIELNHWSYYPTLLRVG